MTAQLSLFAPPPARLADAPLEARAAGAVEVIKADPDLSQSERLALLALVVWPMRAER